MLPQAFLRMQLPNLYADWIKGCQLNNPAHCSREFYRLARHQFFAEWIGVVVPEPKQLRIGQREKFLIIEVPSSPQDKRKAADAKREKRAMDAKRNNIRRDGAKLPRGVDPRRFGYAGLTLQN